MNKTIDMSKLSRVDELSVRKVYIEKVLKEVKKTKENEALLMLANAFDSKSKEKAIGEIVFMERWISDIDKEIKKIVES